MSSTRIASSIFLLILVATTPYWLYLPLIAVAIFIFPFYVEGIILGLLVDALYGSGQHGFFLINFPFALIAAALVLGTPLVRRRLRFNTTH